MLHAKPGDRVRVHYTGLLPDGSVFDSSATAGPFEFTVGNGQVIPGFERLIIGMSPGEQRSETLEPDDAYGGYRQELVFDLPREGTSPASSLTEGQVIEVRQPDGASHPVRILAVSDTAVTVDANHPLAGMSLRFDVTLVEILKK